MLRKKGIAPSRKFGVIGIASVPETGMGVGPKKKEPDGGKNRQDC